jgi:hypothetical protein
MATAEGIPATDNTDARPTIITYLRPFGKGYTPPPGVFPKYKRKTLNSGNKDGFFSNAKRAYMLERGWKEENKWLLEKGNSGLLAIDDGPEIEVTIEAVTRYKEVYTFKDKNDNIFDIPSHEDWVFYTRTKPVPFVPRQPESNSDSSSKNKPVIPTGRALIPNSNSPNSRTRKTRKLKGGFYPSVYGGVSGATVLAPLIARQCLRMYNTKRNRKHVSKRKNKKRTLKRKNLQKIRGQMLKVRKLRPVDEQV